MGNRKIKRLESRLRFFWKNYEDFHMVLFNKMNILENNCV